MKRLGSIALIVFCSLLVAARPPRTSHSLPERGGRAFVFACDSALLPPLSSPTVAGASMWTLFAGIVITLSFSSFIFALLIWAAPEIE